MSNKMAILKQMVQVIIKENKGFDRVLHQATFFEAGNGCCKAEITVEPEIENKMGTLHGGFIATAIDNISTIAFMLNDGKTHKPGVSVNINITYLNAAKSGEQVIFDAKTLKTGKTLAFLTVDVINKKDGVLLAQGQHTKFIGR